MIRAGTTSDHNYLVDSWVGSFSESAVAKSLGTLYRSRWSRLAMHLVSTQRVAVVCDEDAPSVILGWACHDGAGTMHYLFTREDWRAQGRARELVAKISPRIRAYTARTTGWQKHAPLFARTWDYDPAQAWFPELIHPKEHAHGTA